ncbi:MULTISPECIES: hypothetical protein [Streptomyces]|uniref:hypothetical protein n=1 Tax=Streptomyces TaxID=1883 RepID=UPI0031CF10DE
MLQARPVRLRHRPGRRAQELLVRVPPVPGAREPAHPARERPVRAPGLRARAPRAPGERAPGERARAVPVREVPAPGALPRGNG